MASEGQCGSGPGPKAGGRCMKERQGPPFANIVGTKYGEHKVVAFLPRRGSPWNSSYKQRTPQDLGVAGLVYQSLDACHLWGTWPGQQAEGPSAS